MADPTGWEHYPPGQKEAQAEAYKAYTEKEWDGGNDICKETS